MKYDKPKMEVIEIEATDVIVTSFGDGGEGNSTTEPDITPKDDWT